jgi:hypothetical protein
MPGTVCPVRSGLIQARGPLRLVSCRPSQTQRARHDAGGLLAGQLRRPGMSCRPNSGRRRTAISQMQDNKNCQERPMNMASVRRIG